ncbi:cystathionine beta-lyase [Actinobacillus equuli]|nr:cystathionine beta-lyase [Actinobacillus equuli]
MSNFSQLETKFIHAGRKSRYTQGSVNPVVQRASSLVFDSVAQKRMPLAIAIKANYFTADVVRLLICPTRCNV